MVKYKIGDSVICIKDTSDGKVCKGERGIVHSVDDKEKYIIDIMWKKKQYSWWVYTKNIKPIHHVFEPECGICALKGQYCNRHK